MFITDKQLKNLEDRVFIKQFAVLNIAINEAEINDCFNADGPENKHLSE